MWQTRQALEAGTEYTRLDGNQWKAEYRGFVSIEAVGKSPHDSQFELEKAFDAELAQLVARTRRTVTVLADAASGPVPVPRVVRRHTGRRRPAKPAATRSRAGRKR